MPATRTPRHRRRCQPSVETQTLRDLCRHMDWRLTTSTHRDSAVIAPRLVVMVEKLAASRRRDSQLAAQAEERREQAGAERRLQRVMRAMRAELRETDEPCGDDLLRDLAQQMIDDGSAGELLAAARAQRRGGSGRVPDQMI